MINVIDKYQNKGWSVVLQFREQHVDAQSVKNQSIQTDMLRQISTMLKVTACLEDSAAPRINDLVHQLDNLVDDLEHGIGQASLQASHQTSRKDTPSLTIV